MVGVTSFPFVSSDLNCSDVYSFRGCVDGFEPETGLLGWALDLASPQDSLSLRICIDGMSFYQTTTMLARPDVASSLGVASIEPGFCIPRAELIRLERLVAVRPQAEIGVEIGTTSLCIPMIETLPRLSEVVAALGRERSLQTAHNFALERLKQVRQEAAGLAALPLRPFDEARSGFIEAVCVDDQADDLTWIVGWASRRELQDTPVVIVDGRKFDGAITVHEFARADLPIGSAGFVGVIHSAWRFRRASQPIVYHGEGARQHLVSVPNIATVPKHEILNYLQNFRDPAAGPNWADLHGLLTSRNSWLGRTSDVANIQVGVDRLIVVPKLGCFVSGWVLSFVRGVQGFALKIGKSEMVAQSRLLGVQARPDLLIAFPDAAHLVGTAGFTGFFPGDPDLTASDEPLLKVILEQDAAVVHRVGAAHVRRLGHSEPLDSLIQLFPSLDTEQFFPSLVRTIRRELLDRSRELEVERVGQSSDTVVMVMPSSDSDCLLLIEDLRHSGISALGRDVSIILLANQAQRHSKIAVMLREFVANAAGRVGLIFLPDTSAALYALREVVLLANARRFCFVAGNEIPTVSGWRAMAAFFESESDRAVILECLDPETMTAARSGSRSFGCDWETFAGLWSLMPVLVETLPSADQIFDALGNAVMLVPGASTMTQVKAAGRVARLINAAP